MYNPIEITSFLTDSHGHSCKIFPSPRVSQCISPWLATAAGELFRSEALGSRSSSRWCSSQVKPLENHRKATKKTIGRAQENHRKPMGKPEENRKQTIGKL